MRVSSSTWAFLAGMVLAASASLAADGGGGEGPYAIQMHRVAKAGDTYDTHVVFDAKGTSVTTIPGRPVVPQDNAMHADLTGRVVVGAVNGQGNETDLAVTVKQFSVNDEKDAAPPGSILDIHRTDKDVVATIRAGGPGGVGPGALSGAAQQVIRMIYSPINTSNVTDDQVFGSRVPHKVSESWPIDSAMASKQAAGQQVAVDAKNISGTTTLKAVEQANGVPVLRLDTRVEFADARPGDMPTELRLDMSKTTVEFVELVPLDPALPQAETEQIMDARFSCSAAGDAPVKIDVTNHMSQKVTNTPIK